MPDEGAVSMRRGVSRRRWFRTLGQAGLAAGLSASCAGRNEGAAGVTLGAADGWSIENGRVTTRLTRAFGLASPIVQAGMGFVALPELVAAVSNAGGLGILGVSPEPPLAIGNMAEATRRLTDRMFGVDLVHARTTLGDSCTDDHIAACVAARVPLVVFHWDVPSRDWVSRLRDAGARVWMQTGSTDVAARAVENGVDGVVAQGNESGGHVKSDHGRDALLALMRRSLPEPVLLLAAGGIADGGAIARVLAAGADGAWIGTRFLASDEAFAHPEYKQRIVQASGPDATVITTLFGPEWKGEPTRVLRNRVVREWLGREAQVPDPPLGPAVIGRTVLFPYSSRAPYDLPKFSAAVPTPDTTGDFDEMSLAAGTGVRAIKAIKPTARIVEELNAETIEALRSIEAVATIERGT